MFLLPVIGLRLSLLSSGSAKVPRGADSVHTAFAIECCQCYKLQGHYCGAKSFSSSSSLLERELLTVTYFGFLTALSLGSTAEGWEVEIVT